MALENSFQSTQQVFCANAPSAFWRLLRAMPDRTSDVELRLLEIHVRPFQSEGFPDSQSCQVQEDNQSFEILWHVVRNVLDLTWGKSRLLDSLHLGLWNPLNRIRGQKLQCDRKVEHLLQKHVQVQQGLRLQSSSRLLLEKIHNQQRADCRESKFTEHWQEMRLYV